MKQFKTLVALVLALMLMVSVASAATIQVKDVMDGETYTAYKILNYTANSDKSAVSYYLTKAEYDTGLGAALVSAGFAFTASSDGSQYFVNNADSIDVAAAAEALAGNTNIATLALQTYTATGASGSADFGTMVGGYYFVTTTAGSLCALHDEEGITTLVEKNTIPTIDKTEKTSGADYVDGPVDANIGDTIHYQIVITDGTGTDAAITMTDTMTDGLDYTTGSLKINGTGVADDADTTNWKVTVSGRTITIVFSAAYVKSVGTDEPITVTYDATINANAVIDNATGNENKVELDYSKQHAEDKVYVETYDVTLKKTDGSSALAGAKFNLFKQETGGDALKFSSDATGYYLDANGAVEIDAGDGTGVNIRGLEPGDYWFEETDAPDGYNKLAGRTKVTVSPGQTAAKEVTVVNNKGTELPSTGGIGTTIFYIAGAVLVLGAAAIVIARRKAEQH